MVSPIPTTTTTTPRPPTSIPTTTPPTSPTPPTTTTLPTTTTPTTTTPTSTTTTTTPLKTTTPVQANEPPTTELFYENTTHFELTTGSLGTTKAGDSDNLNTTYLILAIVISVIVCVVIILIICFVTYRRGRRKRLESAEMKQQELQITPKNQYMSKGMNGQSQRGIADTNQSAGTSNKMTTVNVTIETDRKNSHERTNQAQSGNGVAMSEPQYINLAMVRDSVDGDASSTHSKVTPSNSQSDGRKLTHNSDQSNSQNNDQSEVAEAFYQNVAQEEDYITPDTNTQHTGEAIYENTTAVESPEENIYEQAMKESDDIYVHMA